MISLLLKCYHQSSEPQKSPKKPFKLAKKILGLPIQKRLNISFLLAGQNIFLGLKYKVKFIFTSIYNFEAPIKRDSLKDVSFQKKSYDLQRSIQIQKQ
ncbi:hypothetical protein BKH42_05825 [Helicobacter sp. 13S00482-2]|nr:hypothetical protein BKH42_05825 [Helicobacter sp. 13S00482-2]